MRQRNVVLFCKQVVMTVEKDQLRSTSPIHVHVEDHIPVHVHVKKPKKPSAAKVTEV